MSSLHLSAASTLSTLGWMSILNSTNTSPIGTPKAPPNSPRLIHSARGTNEPFYPFSNSGSDEFEMDFTIEHFQWHRLDDVNQTDNNGSFTNPIGISSQRKHVSRYINAPVPAMHTKTLNCCCGIEAEIWICLLLLMFMAFVIALLVHTNT